MSLTRTPSIGELAECDREFFMRLLQARCRDEGSYMIDSDELVWSILWLFPEVRYGTRCNLWIGYRYIQAIPQQWTPKHSRLSVIDLICNEIGYDRLLDLGYVPEYRRQPLVFEEEGTPAARY